MLAAPLFFKLPSQLNTIGDVPGLVSSGELNLDTGVVTNFHYRVSFMNTAILTLFGVNPKLPKAPMVFPGPPNAGSTWARFEQREDGKLDFTCAANMFMPLGITFGGRDHPVPAAVRHAGSAVREHPGALPVAAPAHSCQHESSRNEPAPARVPNIPVNTVEEFTVFGYNTSFGDVFGLHIDELGGEATGRCSPHGAREDPVRAAVRATPSASRCSCCRRAACSPITRSRSPICRRASSRGMIRFNEQMRFPTGVTYNQSKLSSTSDPFRIAVGAIDLRTGKVIGELLHPGFVVQQLFVNLMASRRARRPTRSTTRGRRCSRRASNGQTTFRWNGETYLPYPRGFHFPAPTPTASPRSSSCASHGSIRSCASGRWRAGSDGRGVFEGGEDRVRSSLGKEFSYNYSLPLDPARAGRAIRVHQPQRRRHLHAHRPFVVQPELLARVRGGGRQHRRGDVRRVRPLEPRFGTAPGVGAHFDGRGGRVRRHPRGRRHHVEREHEAG